MNVTTQETLRTRRGQLDTASFAKHMAMHKWLYILLVPGVVYMIVFKIVPMLGIVIAFKDMDLVSGIWKSKWIGLDNFKYLFTSKDFYKVLRNSILLSIYQILWGFPAPILLALMLNEIRHTYFKRITQTVLYLPHFISWVVLAGMIMNFLSPTTGVVNYIIKSFGGQSIHFLLKPEYFRTIIVTAEIWKGVGWGTIIYLAAITSIDPSLYESAIIDGANRIQRMMYITIPCISSTIVVLLVLKTGHILDNGFEQIFLLYNPMTYEVADVFETYTYRIGLQSGRFSYATAVGLFKSLVGFLMILGSDRVARKLGQKSIW